jgi:hypothetical protein
MRRLVATLLALLAASSPAAAQPPADVGPVRAVRLTSPVTVDGRLDEAAWRGAPAVRRLTQRDPVEGAVPGESTWVWVAYDDGALYVAARCWDSRPDSIIAQLVRRDVSTASDRFFVYLDTYRDRRSGYYFGITAADVLLDGTLFNDTQSDASWDGVWQGRARREAGPRGTGWSCELKIPVAQLRCRPGAEQVWGINFKRCITRLSETDYLVVLSKKASGFVSRFPDLQGLETARRGRSMELLPYSTGKAEYLVHQANDPFHDGSRYTAGLGADLRASVGNNLTLNATANPDFGQVEVDPAVVNLTDVESFFDEKRPFFTENARVFAFGHEGAAQYWSLNWPEPRFFYSRRVGRTPQGGVPASAEFSDVPMATHILGAAKLTGKPVEGFDFGTLQAVTGRERARFRADGLDGRTAVEPLTYYGLARGLKQLRGGRDGLGLITTLVQRRLPDDGLEDELNRQSLAAGLDGWHFLDRNKVWVLSGWAGMSRVAGTSPRMIALQRSPTHYLQRPDAEHLGVDSSATSLTGYGARVWLNKQQGNVMFNSALGFLSPRFDVNDLGYMSQADAANGHLGAGYKWTEPNRWRKDMSLAGILVMSGNREGDVTGQGLYLNPTVTLANDWTLNPEYFLLGAAKSDRRTRGGPTMAEPAGSWWQLSFDSDPKRRTTWHLVGSGFLAPSAGSQILSLAPAVEWKPASNLSLSVGPGLDRTIEDAQFVTRVAAPGEVPAGFGGRRYVFARLDQTTISANLRLDVSFTRNLTLQTYVQPLVSAARYGGFKELARRGSYEFVRYGLDGGSSYDPATGRVDPGSGGTPFTLSDPSFNYKSLRGNAVLRWEYRPGSVLYFVWTQQRTDYEDTGELRFGPATRRLFDAQADDVFLVKASCHLGL